MQKDIQQVPVNIPNYVYPKDEISLIDLWLTIAKHKKVFWYVFSSIMALGLIAAIVIPKKYSITSTIEIGQTIQDDQVILLESPETVKAKLENALVAEIINQYEDEDIRFTQFDISIPKNSDLVLIQTKAKENEVSQFVKIVTQISNAIEKDHERILKPIVAGIKEIISQKKLDLERENDQRVYEPVIKTMESKLKGAEVGLAKLKDPVIQGYRVKTLEMQIDNAKNKLESLKQRESILNSRKDRLNQLSDLLIYQIAELKEQINKALQLQHSSVPDAKSSEQGMTMLMIDNELQQNRTRLSTLEERLYIDLENQHAELQQEISDNKREQVQQIGLIDEKEKNLKKFHVENKLNVEKQNAEILKLEAQKSKIPADREQKIAVLNQEISHLNERLENIISTRAVTAPMRSQKPAGTTAQLIIGISGVLAIVFGFFSVLVADFTKKVKEYKQKNNDLYLESK